MAARLTAAIAVAVALMASGGAWAQGTDLTVAAFFGTFKGGGIAENRDSIYFGVTVRDFDVSIQPEGGGFRVTWATVIRRGGDPNNPKVRRKEQTVAFLPADKPGVYKAGDNSDPLQGGRYAWARLEKQTLYVYALTIGDDGRYDMQIYERTIKPSGMDFVFHRVQDGQPVRTVKGKLIKYSD